MSRVRRPDPARCSVGNVRLRSARRYIVHPVDDPTDIAGQGGGRRKPPSAPSCSIHEEADDFKWLMGRQAGRAPDGVAPAGEGRRVPPLVQPERDESMAFAEGCKERGTRTVGMIHAHCPELYAVMVGRTHHMDEQGTSLATAAANSQGAEGVR